MVKTQTRSTTTIQPLPKKNTEVDRWTMKDFMFIFIIVIVVLVTVYGITDMIVKSKQSRGAATEGANVNVITLAESNPLASTLVIVISIFIGAGIYVLYKNYQNKVIKSKLKKILDTKQGQALLEAIKVQANLDKESVKRYIEAAEKVVQEDFDKLSPDQKTVKAEKRKNATLNILRAFK